MSVRTGARLVAAAFVVLLCLDAPASAGAAHPRQNIQPSPSFLDACVELGAMSDACISDSVAAINSARSAEPMLRYPLILPSDFRSLSPAKQAFVVLNLERVDRGLRPIVGMVARLNRSARIAAALGMDPEPSVAQLRKLGVHAYRSVYARAYGVLAADYEWLYHDGYSAGGPDATTNVDCPYPDAAGCWGHRESILRPFARSRRLIGGMGSAHAEGGAQWVTAILAGAHGPRPHYTYTWRKSLAHGADGHPIR